MLLSLLNIYLTTIGWLLLPTRYQVFHSMKLEVCNAWYSLVYNRNYFDRDELWKPRGCTVLKTAAVTLDQSVDPLRYPTAP